MITKSGVCASCGREFQGELPEGADCPETDDCPSHVEEKGLVWWGWGEVTSKHDVNGSNPNKISVLLNHFDNEGNAVDSSTMELSETNVSDIVDHAAQLAIVMRDMASKKSGLEAFNHVYAELESALVVAGVIEEDTNPMPVLGLLK